MSSRGSGGRIVLVAAALAAGGLASVVARAVDGDEAPSTTTLRSAIEATPTIEGRRAPGQERVAVSAPADAAASSREEASALPPAPGQGSAAGEPEAVARAFALVWVNRSGEPADLRRQRDRLVALATGPWAREINAQYEVALQGRLGSEEGTAGGEGSVVVAKTLRRTGEDAAVLVVTRERLTYGGRAAEPFRYATYVARLGPTTSDAGFAVYSWEPQG